MTVGELISLLARYSVDAEIIFHDEEIAVYHGDSIVAQIDDEGVLDHPIFQNEAR